MINKRKVDKKKRILLIKYDKNNLDLIINDGFFGYFYGGNQLSEFNEYPLHIDKKFDDYDELIDHLSQNGADITDYKKGTQLSDDIILDIIYSIVDKDIIIDTYLLDTKILPQDKIIIDSINQFVFSNEIPSKEKKISLKHLKTSR